MTPPITVLIYVSVLKVRPEELGRRVVTGWISPSAASTADWRACLS